MRTLRAPIQWLNDRNLPGVLAALHCGTVRFRLWLNGGLEPLHLMALFAGVPHARSLIRSRMLHSNPTTHTALNSKPPTNQEEPCIYF